MIRQTFVNFKRKVLSGGLSTQTELNKVIAGKDTSNTALLAMLGQQKKRGTGDGQFQYKFKEGHSKNFKQEAKFSYFLT